MEIVCQKKTVLIRKIRINSCSWIDGILTSDGKKDIVNLGFKGIFDYPKPVKLIMKFS